LMFFHRSIMSLMTSLSPKYFVSIWHIFLLSLFYSSSL
jgi:hypothetical protein